MKIERKEIGGGKMTVRIKRALAFLMAVIICASSVQLSALADGTVTNPDGSKTVTTTTTSGNTTTVTKKTTGNVVDSSLTGNSTAKVALDKTEITATTVTKDSNGNKTKETVKESESGSKTYTTTVAATTNLPNVTVALKAGSTVKSTGSIAGSSSSKNNNPSIGTDTTTTTFASGTREVTGTMSSPSFTMENKMTAMQLMHYRRTSNNSKVGVWERAAEPNDDNTDPVTDLTKYYIKSGSKVADNYSYYYPEVHYRTKAEYDALPADVKDDYELVYWKDLSTAKNTNADALADLKNYYSNHPELKQPEYVYKLKSLNGWMNPITNGVWWEWIIASNGERAKSSYGNGIKTKNDTHYNPRIAVMIDKNGREAVAYCMDETIISKPNHRYTLENLDEASYFGSNAEAAKLGIRTVAQYGYWGEINSAVGSRQALAADIVALLNSSNASVLTSKTYWKTDGKSTTYSKQALIDFIDIGGSDPKLSNASELSNNTALLATQAALWTYGRSSGQSFDGTNFIGRNNNDKIVMQIVYYYLTSDYLKNKVKNLSKTPLIDESDFFDTSSVKLTVKGKVANHANNKDTNENNDAYYVDVAFTVKYDLKTNDNLTVTLKDNNGNTLKSAKLGNNNSDIQSSGRTYTFKDVQLVENNNIQYTLALTGYQTLVKDAYMFKPVESVNSVQTMVGVGTGTNTVNANSSFKFYYTSKENVTKTVKRVWSWEKTSSTDYVVVSGQKTWNDSDNVNNKRPSSITINLLADGTKKESKTVTASNGWKWTFNNLPKYNASGKAITYTITENAVADYETTISGYNVTNKLKLINVAVEKIWSDSNNQDGIRPSSVTVRLLANGADTGKTVTLNASNSWKGSFNGLDATKTYTVEEVGVPSGYTVAVSGSSSAGFKVTNTHTPEKISISGIKTWNDGDNQDGTRPESITINLLADGEKKASKVVRAADEWKWTFTDLDKYANGKEIQYTITENAVNGYDTAYTDNNLNVTNTLRRINIPVEKVWDDEDNQDGKRPGSVVVELLENGAATGKTLTLNEANQWKGTFENLPDGKTYTVREVEVPNGYTVVVTGSAENGFTVTNTHEPEETEVNVTKVWDDAENQDGKRPEKITIRLYADGEEVQRKTVQGSAWECTFTDLPKYKEGTAIVYTITEDSVENYTASVDGFTVTNSHTPEKISISGTKTWDDADNQDGKRPTGITVRLLADNIEYATQTVTAADGWNYTFDNLPKYKDGKLINYTVTEAEVDGYTLETKGYDLVNKYKPEETQVTVTKVWDDANDQDGIRPEKIEVELYKDGELYKTETVKASNGWSYTFDKLPKYKNQGQLIQYTIKEVAVEGYQTTLDGYTITNKHKPEEISISGTKTWNDANDQDGKRPESITVNLLADGVVKDTKTVTGTGDTWNYEFKNLPKFAAGKEIVYTVAEEEVAHYIAAINGYNLENTHIPEKISINGSKTWNDGNNQDGIRPESITIRLKVADTEIASKVVTAADGWAWSFEDLPKYENGSEINYVISEDPVQGYEAVVTGDAKTGYTVTNTHKPEEIEISGSKEWEDGENQDGIRPTEIIVRLHAGSTEVANKKVNASTNWSFTFTNLPKYEDGQEIVYTITEDAVAGYDAIVTGSVTDGLTVINKHKPEVIEVAGSKIWEDANNQDGIRPTGITIRLYADGEEIDSATVTGENNWAYSFTNLPKFAAGKAIVYTIDEDEVAGYTTNVDGYNVTNTHVPETTDVEGVKTWNDNDDQDGIRPERITIRLYADGVEVESATVTAAGNWGYSFKDLPKYAAGEAIVYTIGEDEVAGYATSVNGYNVTNTHNPEKISVSGSKTWVDKDDEDRKRPESITIHLYANGELVESRTATEETGWRWSFENLDKYANGQEIEYTIEEADVPGYAGVVNGFDVTNTYVPEMLNIAGNKVWDDADNQDGRRPESITVNLLADGTVVRTVTVTEADDWEWTFENLPVLNKGVVINYTIEEEPVEGYEVVVTGDVTNGFTVTNTHVPETTNVSGVKTWNDNNDEAQKRPESITINLLANGTKVESKVVTAESNWTWEFENLDKYAHGRAISYTITEDPVNAYVTEMDGYNVINTYAPDEDDIDRKIQFTKTALVSGDTLYALSGIEFDIYYVGSVSYYTEHIEDYKTPDLGLIESKQLRLVETVKTGENGKAVYNLSQDTDVYEDGEKDGVYMIVEREHPAILEPLDPFFVAVPMTSQDGSRRIYTVDLHPKNEFYEPKISKDVLAIDNNEGSVFAGEAFTWISRGDVPEDIADAKGYEITDTLDYRLTYADNLAVKVQKQSEAAAFAYSEETDLVEGIDYNKTLTPVKVELSETMEEDTVELTVTLTPEGIRKVSRLAANADEACEVRVYFDTIIDEDAEIDQDIPNQAKLVYTNAFGYTFEVKSDNPYVYTCGVKIEKCDADDNTIALAGAEFKLARKATDEDQNAESWVVSLGKTEEIVFVDFYDNADLEGTRVSSVVTDENGEAMMYGIAAGEYYLIEVNAPAGYRMLRYPQEISIAKTTQSDGNAIVVENSTSFALPGTGGIGTNVFTLVGAALTIGSGVTLAIKRKKEDEEE